MNYLDCLYVSAAAVSGNRVCHGIGIEQAKLGKLDYGGSVLGSSQFLLPPQLMFASKVVKSDSKTIVSLR